jgi:hypothetical protein
MVVLIPLCAHCGTALRRSTVQVATTADVDGVQEGRTTIGGLLPARAVLWTVDCACWQETSNRHQ